MRKVARYQTADGVVHENLEKATKHADERYGNALLKLAHELVRVTECCRGYERCQRMSIFLEDDANIQKFIVLKDLKADIAVNPNQKEVEDDSI